MVMRFGIVMLLLLSTFMAEAQKIHLKKEGTGYWILENKEKVFFFQRQINDSIPTYARNNYFHPVYDLNGQCITEDFPSHHLHHRGIFWAWHQILVNGESICDAWDIKNFFQNITQLEFSGSEADNGVLSYTSFWHTKDNPDDPFLMEKTKVTIHPKRTHYRQIDFEISFRALEENLRIGGSDNEKGYGGFSVRMKTDENTQFTNEKYEKITPTNLALPGGHVVDLSNPQRKSGVSIISWDQNPGVNQWILRQTGSAQNHAWPGRAPVNFEIEKPVTLKYTLLIHKGKFKKIPLNTILKKLK